MNTHPLRAASIALFSLGLAACGGASPQSAYPQQEPLPATADETMVSLNRAEDDLRLALGKGSTGAPSASSLGQPGAASPPPPASPPSPSPASADERPSSAASGPAAQSSDPCANVCRALASMERAATHLCDLAGSDDARCEVAKSRVKSASLLVRDGCPACASS